MAKTSTATWRYAFCLIEDGRETGRAKTVIAPAGTRYAAATQAYRQFSEEEGWDFSKGRLVMRARVFSSDEVELLHESFDATPHVDGLLRIVPG